MASGAFEKGRESPHHNAPRARPRIGNAATPGLFLALRHRAQGSACLFDADRAQLDRSSPGLRGAEGLALDDTVKQRRKKARVVFDGEIGIGVLERSVAVVDRSRRSPSSLLEGRGVEPDAVASHRRSISRRGDLPRQRLLRLSASWK